MDPYLRSILGRLGDLDPIDVLTATPIRLADLADVLTDEGWSASHAPGKWPAGTVLAHLVDTELGLGFRLRQAVTAPLDLGAHRVQPFDQDAWAARSARADPSLALEAFRALRAWNLTLLAGFSLDDWMREMLHHERGLESVDTLVRFLAGHDLHHLDQLEAVAHGA
ncbi:MAG: DinB family protein [Trueperaceae bacterium]|nr:MAG: DinB family protein [Trueperaceae bacterium]